MVRRSLRAAALPMLAVPLAVTVLLAGCGTTDSWVDAAPAAGFSAQYADARNSGVTDVDGARAPTLDWERSVKGTLGAAPATGGGAVALNGATAAGCSLMVWENGNRGRQRWCTRMVLGGAFASPLVDGFDNLYVGQPGQIVAYPTTQWTRWRTDVIGMPTTLRFVGGGRLLVATHLGQVLVVDAHRGTVEGAPVDLVTGVDPRDPLRGIEDCPVGGPLCPVAAAPAFSAERGVAVLRVWQPGAERAGLVALRYTADRAALTPAWTSDAVAGGVVGSPVLSADGATVYVAGADGALWALGADDGAVRWSVALGYRPQFPPSVSPAGVVIAGGAAQGATLVAVRDDGDRGEVLWRADDGPLTAVSRAGEDTGYTVVRDGDDGLALLVFDAGDGSTLARRPLPGATGWPVGVSVGADRRVVTATSDGTVYGFSP